MTTGQVAALTSRSIERALRADIVEALGFREERRENALRRVTMIAATALRVRSVAIFVFHGDTPQIAASFGRTTDSVERQAALCASVVHSGQPLFIDDVRQSEWASLASVDAPEDEFGLFASIPIRSPIQRVVIGALCVYQSSARQLSIAEQRLLGECAGLIEDDMVLRQLCLRDELTGLLNRREFDLQAGAEFRRAHRGNSCLSVAILDIDFFKQVNDHFGHARGDAVLQQVANQVRHFLRRDVDAVGRYGGEEFALAMPGLDLEHAQQRLMDLCGSIRRLQIPNPGSPLGVLTVSIGLASLERPDEFAQVPPPRLLAYADEALYRAKASGRNQVCAHALRVLAEA